MPYINKEDRLAYDWYVKRLSEALDKQGWPEGHVNYLFFSILKNWFKFESRYHTICRIMGTLRCVGDEFYRRIAAPYEDDAIKKNGDIA